MEMPPWWELADIHPPCQEEPEATQPQVGRQQRASRKLENKFLWEEVCPCFSVRLLLSQNGPLAFSPLIAPLKNGPTFPCFLSAHAHVPMCRQLDKFGHYRAACAVGRGVGEKATRWRWLRPNCAKRLELVFPPTSTSGAWILPSARGVAESSSQSEFNNLDGRRLEVAADSFFPWHGAQGRHGHDLGFIVPS